MAQIAGTTRRWPDTMQTDMAQIAEIIRRWAGTIQTDMVQIAKITMRWPDTIPTDMAQVAETTRRWTDTIQKDMAQIAKITRRWTYTIQRDIVQVGWHLTEITRHNTLNRYPKGSQPIPTRTLDQLGHYQLAHMLDRLGPHGDPNPMIYNQLRHTRTLLHITVV